MKKFLSLLLMITSLWACKDGSTTTTEATQTTIEEVPNNQDMDPVTRTASNIAKAHGIDNWKDVKEIKFTWNVDRGERHFERLWTWWPKDDIVEVSTEEGTFRYLRTEVNEVHQTADPEFINDSFWLLAPFHLIWDDGITLRESKNKVAPISGDTLPMLTLTYGEVGGYTPGDAYDFYYGSDYLIKEWVFRQGNDSVPTMATTWEDYTDVGGLMIGTTHTDSTQSFKIHFSDISVKK
ncbi:MAG: hypothetical protein AAF466_00275 [Bacteroidota bacterium]